MIPRTATIPSDTPEPADWLDENGQMRLMNAAEIDKWAVPSRQLWGARNSRYGFVTQELIDWLRAEINGSSAIEIGAGHGDICHHLGIMGTDSFVQRDNPEARALLALAAFGTTTQLMRYGPHVQKFDALDAVKAKRPQTVVASWVTQYWPRDLVPLPGVPANMFGVKEEEILPLVDKYILIGNVAVHQHKKIMKLPHKEIAAPWLRSRAIAPELDRIWVWSK